MSEARRHAETPISFDGRRFEIGGFVLSVGLVDRLPFPSLILAGQTLVHANPSWFELTGPPDEQFAMTDWLVGIHDDDRDDAAAFALSAEAVPRDTRFRCLTGAGDEVLVAARVRLLPSPFDADRVMSMRRLGSEAWPESPIGSSPGAPSSVVGGGTRIPIRRRDARETLAKCRPAEKARIIR